MTIKEKMQQVLNNKKYNFCGIDFEIYDTDYVRVYDKVNGACIFTEDLNMYKELNDIDILNKEYKKEEIIKLPKDYSVKHEASFAICFYLEAPEKIEKPISAGARFI